MEKLLSYMQSHSQHLEALTVKIDSLEERLRPGKQNSRHSEQQRDYATHVNHPGGAEAEKKNITEDIPRRLREPERDGHRTAPHKLLLLWPSVHSLLRTAGVEHHQDDVKEAEDRDLLRSWTRGEGSIDEHDGTEPGGPASPARGDESSEAGHAGSPRASGLWGVGSPSIPNSDSRRSEPYGTAGLCANNEVNLDINTINHLYCSYCGGEITVLCRKSPLERWNP